MLISCNLLSGNFWNFFHIYSNQSTTSSYGYICLKMIFFKNLVLVLKMAVLKQFWWQHSQGTLGIKALKWLGITLVVITITKYITNINCISNWKPKSCLYKLILETSLQNLIFFLKPRVYSKKAMKQMAKS